MKVLNSWITMYDEAGYDGYIITNDCMPNTASDEGDYSKPGIKLMFQHTENGLDYILQYLFEYAPTLDNGDHQYFIENYDEILRGELSLWKLIAVKVHHNFMWLDFFSPELYKAYMFSGEKGMLKCLPDYAESLVFDFNQLDEGSSFAKTTHYVHFSFRISVENTSQTDERVDVCFSPPYTIITEYYNNRKREICLPGSKIDGNFRRIPVTEYYR